MHVENITDLQALAFVAGVIAFAVVLFRVVPGVGMKPVPDSYAEEEIRGYDFALPKYFLASVLALTVGALHAAIKSIPPIEEWLATGGHGGHLVRDMSNSHLNIVVGGTIAASGLTWLVLPRVLRRPLASRRLATISFWATLVGATGFYLSNLVLGVVLARMYHSGIPYDPDAKAMLGLWRTIPIAASASVMGIGYWAFGLDVVLTVVKRGRIRVPRPDVHLAKYFLVGALGLTVGTVQGVIQVMPKNEAWLHATAPAGEYIDPIAHAHVNLVTGLLMLIAGVTFWATRTPGSARERRTENVVFWLMLVGSGTFYLTFMRIGWVEGHLMSNQGLTWDQAVHRLGLWHSVPIAVAGTLMLAGLWSLLYTVARRCLRNRLTGPARALMLAGCAALFVGSSQGLAQVVPATKAWIEGAGEYGAALVNAHAQLNMLGGVILMIFALGLVRAEEMFAAPAPPEVGRALLRWSVPGIAVYWVSAVIGNVAAGQILVARGGAVGYNPADEVAERVHSAVATVLSPLGMMVGAALYGFGFAIAAGYAWAATRDVRATGWARLLVWADAYQGSPPAWTAKISPRYYVAAELPGACSGFPGIGWIMSGRSLIGLPLALLNPAITWGLIPVLTSAKFGVWLPLTIAWLVATGGLSVGMLALLTRRGRRRPLARATVVPTPEPLSVAS